MPTPDQHKIIAAICDEVEHCTLPVDAIMTDKQVTRYRMYEAARRAFVAATLEAAGAQRNNLEERACVTYPSR